VLLGTLHSNSLFRFLSSGSLRARYSILILANTHMHSQNVKNIATLGRSAMLYPVQHLHNFVQSRMCMDWCQICWQHSTVIPVKPSSKPCLMKNTMHRHIIFRQFQTIGTCIQLNTTCSLISNGPHIVVAISICEYWQHVPLKAQ
jgi:hypothetical protein